MQPPQASPHEKVAKKIKDYIYDPYLSIGNGARSKVFPGIIEKTKMPVAIKVIELSNVQNEVEKYLLQNELDALRSISHKNVIRLYDVLSTKNNVYIVTELCERGDLHEFVTRGTPLSEMEALSILRDIADGYVAIALQGIIHRDLKTSNIFLSQEGAKIGDFGFCDFIGKPKPAIHHNVGSPAYMSPEALNNVYSEKSDIWAIGIILYEMVTGTLPDRTRPYREMANNLIQGNFKENVTPTIRRILQMCFKANLTQRIDAISLLRVVEEEVHKQNLERDRAKAMLRKSKVNQQSNLSRPMQPQLAASRLQSKVDHTGSEIIKQNIFIAQFLLKLMRVLHNAKNNRLFPYRIVLLRHMAFLEQSIANSVQAESLQLNTETFRGFETAKNDFYDLFVGLESSSQLPDTMRTVNLKDYTNMPFRSPQALQAYIGASKEVSEECASLVRQNQFESIAECWDLCILHWQMLRFYLEGVPSYAVSELLQLGNLLSNIGQRKLKGVHHELLEIKHNFLIGNKQ